MLVSDDLPFVVYHVLKPRPVDPSPPPPDDLIETEQAWYRRTSDSFLGAVIFVYEAPSDDLLA